MKDKKTVYITVIMAQTGPGLERAFNSCVYCRIPLFVFGFDRLTHRLIETRVETRDRESCGDLRDSFAACCVRKRGVLHCDQPAQP